MPSPPSPPNSGDRRRRGERDDSSGGGGGSGGLVFLIGLGLGFVLTAALGALFSTDSEENNEVEKKRDNDNTSSYYRLPPRGANVVDDDDNHNATEADSAGPKCVCCQDRPQRFMFVECRHICLCEPCLAHMAREYEDTELCGPFDGPVKLRCPICRQSSHVVRTYAS